MKCSRERLFCAKFVVDKTANCAILAVTLLQLPGRSSTSRHLQVLTIDRQTENKKEELQLVVLSGRNICRPIVPPRKKAPMPLQYDLADIPSMDPADHVSLPQRGCAVQPQAEDTIRPPAIGERTSWVRLDKFAWLSGWRSRRGAADHMV